MSTLASLAATSEILAVLALCFSTTLGIAYVFLKLVVTLTTHVNTPGQSD